MRALEFPGSRCVVHSPVREEILPRLELFLATGERAFVHKRLLSMLAGHMALEVWHVVEGQPAMLTGRPGFPTVLEPDMRDQVAPGCI